MEPFNRVAKIQQVADKLNVPLETVERWDREYVVTEGGEQVGFFLPAMEGHDPVIIEYNQPLPKDIQIEKA